MYQTSKYLARLYQGLHLLRGKLEAKGIALELGAEAESKSKTILDGLVKIRGAKGNWAGATEDEKNAEAKRLAQQVYGTDDIDVLKLQILSEVQAINAEVRSKLTMRAGQEETRDYFKMRDPRDARLQGGKRQ